MKEPNIPAPEKWSGPKRAALYARVSTDDKGQRPELQLDALREYVKQRGWVIVGEYVDVGVSGAKVSRPRLDALMEDARGQRVDAVVVWRFDRFARSSRHLLAVLDEFRGIGVDFISTQEQIDTSTPVGKVMFTLIAAMAEFERALLSERVKAGIAHARSKGQRWGRKPKKIDLRPAVAMLSMGHSLEQTAKAVGVPRRTLQRHLEAAGSLRSVLAVGQKRRELAYLEERAAELRQDIGEEPES